MRAGPGSDAIDECLRLTPRSVGCRLTRVLILAESNRPEEARAEAAALQQQAPQLTAGAFATFYAPQAKAIVDRRMAAALRSGMKAPPTVEQ